MEDKLPSQTATVGFKNFEIECVIGVLPEERGKRQPILIDLEARFHQKKVSEDLRPPLGYEELAVLCQKIATEEFFLLESFAEKVLDALFLDDRIHYAKVCLKKTEALKKAEYCFVNKERER